MRHLGVPRSRIHAIRTCLHPTSAVETPKEGRARLRESLPRIRAELQDALRDSKWVLCLGAEAWTAVSGKERFWNWIGAPYELESDNATCLPTFSPGFIFSKGGVAYADLFRTHVQRFAALASGSLAPWSWPPIHVDNDDAAIEALTRIAASTEPVGVDIETDGIELDSDLVCIGFATRSEAVSVTIAHDTNRRLLELTAEVLEQPHRKKVWQNGSYDRRVLEHKEYKLGGENEDTLLLHSLLEPHHKHTLGFIASSYLHAPAWKAEHEAESELVKSSTRFSRASEKFRETRVYNAKDALVQRLIYEAIR